MNKQYGATIEDQRETWRNHAPLDERLAKIKDASFSAQWRCTDRLFRGVPGVDVDTYKGLTALNTELQQTIERIIRKHLEGEN